jgi:hypothetical protein
MLRSVMLSDMGGSRGESGEWRAEPLPCNDGISLVGRIHAFGHSACGDPTQSMIAAGGITGGLNYALKTTS